MRRVDRRTNALQTDRPTDQPTDTASYRGALSHLKKNQQRFQFGFFSLVFLQTSIIAGFQASVSQLNHKRPNLPSCHASVQVLAVVFTYSMAPSMHQFIHLTIYPSIQLPNYPYSSPIHLSVLLSLPFVELFVYPFIHRFLHQMK